MPRQPAWTEQENEALAALYFRMLDDATAGTPYNKAALIRDAQNPNLYVPSWAGKLASRSRGSIEAKLMNASAAHRDLCHAAGIRSEKTMDGFGYRCLSNYQADLKDAIRDVVLSRWEAAGFKWAEA